MCIYICVITQKLITNKLLKPRKMSLKSKIISTNTMSFAKHLFIYSIIFISILVFFSTTETIVNSLYNQKLPYQTDTATTSNETRAYPKWLEAISGKFKVIMKEAKIAVVDMEGEVVRGLESLLNAEVRKVEFERVSEKIRWRDLYPLWIDEEEIKSSAKCPEIPMASDIGKYRGVDIVLANLSCGNWSKEQRVGIRDVYRLQVSLMAGKLAVESGNKEVYVVFIVGGVECEPMLEMFRCDELVWHGSEYWVYKPDVNRIKQKLSLPIGSCQVATHPHFFQPPEKAVEESRTETRSKGISEPRKEAYVTLLHSSELYVCGAIALAQSILQSNTTKDLLLLADHSISPRSIDGLMAAGWKIKRIQRVRCPTARKGHYNEWNCSKLRIWQLVNYAKVIFIDADFIVLKNIDYLFSYPQLSASEDTMSIFNSGVMIVEPSACFFNMLMAKRYSLNSYNGGDQGLLNEVFTWWHRITKKITFLKCFMDENYPREVPDDVSMIHFVGVKPWVCYRDYDCNWDQIDRHIFASDLVHSRWWQVYDSLSAKLKPYCGLTTYMDANIHNWRQIAKNNLTFTDTHWNINVTDPRKYNLITQL